MNYFVSKKKKVVIFLYFTIYLYFILKRQKNYAKRTGIRIILTFMCPKHYTTKTTSNWNMTPWWKCASTTFHQPWRITLFRNKTCVSYTPCF